ncbi:chromosome segregation DNA-binding protein [Desulfocurvibacter africanus PCS]|uniref:Chromosome segregation DNA-binding protein n=1 Tax=Desulfocurvibacter africanus PCS TaxID=1262666 RepID=M5Q2I5_DESAF|nr:ParB/RepB/Spo0J family partition protein [Desulfocurvibacter africanus]EMG38481.1 chromosome segregation DNA-binding protein [Desulfocurvibacter africanus PCS]
MAGPARGLGRGLDALLGGGKTDLNSPEVRMLQLDVIRPNPDQPRTVFSDSGLEELTESIKSQGVLQPILVRPIRGDVEKRYEIVAGERRWRASRKAGLTEIPALIKELSQEESLAIALIENLQREDLNPMEEARGLRELQERLSCSQEDLAKKIGKSRSAVTNTLRLLQLPDNVQVDLGNGVLTAGHGRAIMAVTEPEAQEEMRRRIVEGQLSVRQAEAMASWWKKNGSLPELEAGQTLGVKPQAGQRKKGEPMDSTLVDIQKLLCNSYGVKVNISGNQGQGRISFRYSSQDELQRLIERFGSMQ